MRELRVPNSFQLVLLCILGAIAIFSSTMAKSPVLPYFSSYLGTTDLEKGLIGAASPATGILVSAPIGILMDRKGAKSLLWVAALLFAFVPFLYFFVTIPIQLVIVRFVHGIATAILGPVALAIVAQKYGAQRGEKMALYSSSTRVGRMVAPLVGGFLLAVPLFDSFGIDIYRGIYLVCGLFGLMVLGATALLSPSLSVPPKDIISDAKPIDHSSIREVLKWDVMLICVAQAGTFFLYGAYEFFIPLYWTESIGLPEWGAGPLFALLTFVILFSGPIVGRMSDVRGRIPFIVLGLSALCISLIITILIPTLLVQVVLIIPIGIAIAFVDSTTSPLITERVGPSKKGTALGLLSTIMDVGHSSGPLFLGLLLGASGHSYAFAFTVISIVILTIPLLIFLKIGRTGEALLNNR